MCCETWELLSWLSLQGVFSPSTPEVQHKKNITCCFLSFSIGEIVCQWGERWWISRHCFVPFPLLPISPGKAAINWSAGCYWGQNSNQGGGKDPGAAQADLCSSARSYQIPLRQLCSCFVLGKQGKPRAGVICKYKCQFSEVKLVFVPFPVTKGLKPPLFQLEGAELWSNHLKSDFSLQE